MSVDSVARALAVQAQPVDTLATGIPSVNIPAGNKVIRTKGYSVLGKGIGHYVCDALATPALAAAQPRFCKQSADLRYWRLSVEGGINVLQAGAAGDDETGAGTNDGAAFLAALAYLQYHAALRADNGIGKGGPKLTIPALDFYLGTTTLDITFALIVEGMNGGLYSGGGTRLRWANGVTGIRTHRYNTTLAATGNAGTNIGATGAVLRNLNLKGGYAGTESESHGIQLRETAHLENVSIAGFSGDGIYAYVALGDAIYEGQSNFSSFTNVYVTECRNGFYFNGDNCNGMAFNNCYAQSNRRYGYWGVSGISNSWTGGGFASNGLDSARPTKCSHGGNHYYVLPNQSAGASTNAPKASTVTMTIASPGVVTWTAHGLSNGTGIVLTTTGALPTGLTAGTTYFIVNGATNTFQLSATVGGAAINTTGSQSGTHTAAASVNNTWWGYLKAGGVEAGWFPAWTNGMTLRDGGSFRTDGAGESGQLTGPYFELDQSWPLASGRWGAHGIPLKRFDGSPHGGQVTYDADGNAGAGITVPGLFYANFMRSKSDLWIGPDTSSTAFDPVLTMDSNNAYTFVNFKLLGALQANITIAAGEIRLSGNNGVVLYHGANAIGMATTAGLLVSYAGAKLGYGTGAGGTVTQATSKSTGATLNKSCGQVTMNGAALAASTSVSFTLTNSVIAATDTVVVSIGSAATANSYVVQVDAVAAGSCRIQLRNISAGSLSEAVVLNFAVIKAVTA